MVNTKYYDVEYTTYIWRLRYPGFPPGSNICSRNFSVDSCGINSYFLKLVLKPEYEEYNELSILLAKAESSSERSAIVFNLKISISGPDIDEHYSHGNFTFAKSAVTIFKKSIKSKRNANYCLSTDSAFVVKVEIERVKDVVEIYDFWACRSEDLEILSSDLARAFSTKRYWDLTFRSIDNKYVKLSKCILGARYPTLATTLNLYENPRREYDLEIDSNALQVLLQYLYCGKIYLSNSTYEFNEILKKSELLHLQHALYPVPRIITVSTSVPSKHASFVWVIPKSSCLKNGSFLVNYLRCDDSLEWTKLRVLFCTKQYAEDERCISFKIQRMVEEGKLYMICKITLVGREEYSRTYEHVFESGREMIIPSFIEMKSIKIKGDCFWSNDTLKICFEFIISNLKEVSEYDSVRYLAINKGKTSVAKNLWALQKGLAHLYRNPSSSDIAIKVGELVIPAHKVLLSARSPVLSQILENKEIKTMAITNYGTYIVLQILRYIYCAEIDNESESTAKSQDEVVELYKAAHEYQLLPLRQKCACFLETTLDISSFFMILKLADECRDKFLQDRVVKFVSSHSEEVFKSEVWQKLIEERIDLADAIINAVFE